MIGHLDREETKRRETKLAKLYRREQLRNEREQKDKEISERVEDWNVISGEECDCDNCDMDKEEEFTVKEIGTKRKRRHMSGVESSRLSEFLTNCDRFNVSETAASTLFNLQGGEAKINQSQVHKKKRKLRLDSVNKFGSIHVPEA